jgi:chaperonin cofactor prefoldin
MNIAIEAPGPTMLPSSSREGDRKMNDTELQATLEKLDSKIDALADDMRAGFDRADKQLESRLAETFTQTQGGFDASHDFAMFLDERLRGDMNARFDEVDSKLGTIDRRFDAVDARFDRLETRFDGLETRFDGLETRFDRLEMRFDGLEKLIKEL